MASGEPLSVLMVEDDPGDARLIRTLLGRTALKPLQVTVVDRVSGALDLLRRNGKVDVALLDVSLPDSRPGSLDSLTRIKAEAPDLPLILLTGIDDEELAVRAVREGAQDYLVKKGIDSGLLGRAIRYAIERQRDITARKLAEERLLHDALHDHLTGLPNRALFMDRLGMAIAHAKRRLSYTYAVLFIDLDRFKNVNDSLGHSVGDELLIDVARRLEACLRPGDTVARLGGDEFTILLDEVADVDHAVQVAQRLHREMARPFKVQVHEVFVTMSLGITLGAGGHYNRPEEVLRDADTAMYGAKTSGKARDAVFDYQMHDRAVALLELETDLRRAVERAEFEIYYQPIVSLATGKIDAFEALLRWRHPRRGLLVPDSFVPVAEDTGLIVPIGWWVLHEACRQLADWQSLPWTGQHLAVTVNLSGKQFMQADLVERVEEILRSTGIRSGSLRLEMTESTIMEQAEEAVEKLMALRRLGVKLYIDDFGTGYSSLSYLHRLPVDALKIDRSFISEMDSEAERAEIVGTIVTLARTLRMDVAAEGIETAEQVTRLRALACHYGQGFFFSEPLGSSAAGGLIETGASW
jgi:diguanylate cyclase (GGDEF)-like protein